VWYPVRTSTIKKNFPPHPFCFAALPCEVTFVQKFHFCHTRQLKNNKIKTWSSVQSASLSWWCYLQMSEKCVLHVLSVWQNNGCVGGLLNCAKTRCFQHYCVDHDQPLLARHTIQTRFFSSKWFKPPRDHFLFGNSLKTYMQYCLFFFSEYFN